MNALDRHRALLAAATPGPWTTKVPPRDKDGWQTGVRIIALGGNTAVYSNHQGGQFPFADAQLIAAAVNAHPLLLDLWTAALDVAAEQWATSNRAKLHLMERMRDILAKLETMQ